MQEVTLNSRVEFPKGMQRQFLKEASSSLNIRTSELANIICIHERTLRDWKREKYNMSFGALFSLCYKLNTNFPKNTEVRPTYWSINKASRLGAKRYRELYSNPGTLESRRKGGLMTQRKFREDQNYAKKLGLITRKKIKYPDKSIELAEFIGIMLGDGGIRNNYQIGISFNYKLDLPYAYHIQNLVKKLFSVTAVIRIREKHGDGSIIISSRSLVEFLYKHGIRKGNKIKQQIDIPAWVFNSLEYKIACLKGLMDTDGGLFHHKYTVNGKQYKYLKMCFTSYSQPLLKSVMQILSDLELNPKNTAKNRVYLYSLDQVKKYFKIVGSNNPRYLNAYKLFLTRCK